MMPFPIFFPMGSGGGGASSADIGRRILRDFKLEDASPKKLKELAWAIRQVHPERIAASRVFIKIGIALLILTPITTFAVSMIYATDLVNVFFATFISIPGIAIIEMLSAGAFFGVRYIFTGREWP